jgi:hypothetical protein
MCYLTRSMLFYSQRYTRPSLKYSQHRAYCIMLFFLLFTRRVCTDGGAKNDHILQQPWSLALLYS